MKIGSLIAIVASLDEFRQPGAAAARPGARYSCRFRTRRFDAPARRIGTHLNTPGWRPGPARARSAWRPALAFDVADPRTRCAPAPWRPEQCASRRRAR